MYQMCNKDGLQLWTNADKDGKFVSENGVKEKRDLASYAPCASQRNYAAGNLPLATYSADWLLLDADAAAGDMPLVYDVLLQAAAFRGSLRCRGVPADVAPQLTWRPC